jgi:hypothetical protein
MEKGKRKKGKGEGGRSGPRVELDGINKIHTIRKSSPRKIHFGFLWGHFLVGVFREKFYR